MDRNASYMDACRMLSEEISKREKGSSHVLVAREGYGENEVISYLHKKLEQEGIKFFRGSRYLKTELAKYHLFNEVLNDALDEFKNRDIESLMSEYLELLKENSNGSMVIVAEGLESVSEESRDFFLYLSRLTGKYNFKIIGTFTTSLMNAEGKSSRFLQIIETEEVVQTIHIDKMKLEDLKFFLELNGYNLPDRFLNDLFRLVDGNMSTLKYVLKYYEDHGIINDKKGVDDVVYRFFPIPQGVEIYFDRVFSELSEKQNFVAQLMALIQEESTYRRLSQLSGIEETELLGILGHLEKAGIATENGLKYDISNYRVRDFILGRMSNTKKLEIYSALSASQLFDELPLQMKLNVMLQKGEYKRVGEYLNKLGKSVISKFSSLDSLIKFLDEFSKSVDDRGYYFSATLTKCEAIEMLGEPDKALACYDALLVDFPEEISPRISLARITGEIGDYDKALDMLSKIGQDCKISEKEKGELLLAEGGTLKKIRNYQKAGETIEEAVTLMRGLGDRASEAEALNTLGNICLETFRHGDAMGFYEKALEINRELGHLRSASKNLNNIAIAKTYFGEYSEAGHMLGELIESSYLTGDVITRAYATYNLAETYYIMGRMDDVASYIPSALKLVEVANRNSLRYYFYRFLSLYYLNTLDLASALSASEKALESMESNKDGQLYKIAYALRELFKELVSGDKSDILPELLEEDFEEEEEFLPIFYTIGAVYSAYNCDLEAADKISRLGLTHGRSMGEKFGLLMSIVHRALILVFMEEKDELSKFVSQSPKPETGVPKYDYLMKIFKEIIETDSKTKEQFLSSVKKLSGEVGESQDLTRLYKETAVAKVLKCVYNSTPDISEIATLIPQELKHMFNTFVENHALA